MSELRSPGTVVLRGDDRAAMQHAARLLAAAGIAPALAGAGAPADIVILLSTGDAGARIQSIRAAATPDGAMVAAMPADTAGGLLRRALRAGADGILLDGTLDETLVPGVNAVAAGLLAVPCSMRKQVAPRHLSYREKEILALVVQGLTNRQIAGRLYLAESTVKTHLSSAFAKLDAGSRAEAAALVLDPDDGAALGVFTGDETHPPP